jgi:hypothetical protein
MLAIVTARHGIVFTFNEFESWGAYMQAYNLLHFDPTRTFLLADDTFLPGKQVDHPYVYVSNPWMIPRLTSAALQLLGVTNFLISNLVICLVLYTTVCILIITTFAPTSSVIKYFIAFLILDYFGFFRSIGNSASAWHYLLFFFCLYSTLAAKQARVLMIFSSFFLLWQFLIHFAIFTSLTCLIALCLTKEPRTRVDQNFWNTIAWICTGSALSLSIFIGQLLAYLGGFRNIYNRFIETVAERNNDRIEEAPRRFVDLVNLYDRSDRIWSMPADSWQLLRHTAANAVAQYGDLLCIIVVIGLAGGLFIFVLRGITPKLILPHARNFEGALKNAPYFEIRVLLASAISYIAVGALFKGQVYQINVYHYHPMLFPVLSLGAAIGADLISKVAQRALKVSVPLKGGAIVNAIVFIAFAALCIRASAHNYEKYPSIDGDGFWSLYEKRYRGMQFSLQIPYGELVWNSTGVVPFYVNNIVRPNLEETEKLAHSDYVFCIDHWSAQKSRPKWTPIMSCHEMGRELITQGHQLTASGISYVIIKLDKTVYTSSGEKLIHPR